MTVNVAPYLKVVLTKLRPLIPICKPNMLNIPKSYLLHTKFKQKYPVLFRFWSSQHPNLLSF